MQIRPMRFHWFWSHISMIMGALSGLAMIVNAFELRPTVAPELQWTFYIDIGFAIIYAVVCLWAFCLRNKRTATAWYFMLTPPLMRIAYTFAAIFLYKKLGVETINLWSQILVYSICWILVFVYYHKRKSLFFDRVHYEPTLNLSSTQSEDVPSFNQSEINYNPTATNPNSSDTYTTSENGSKYCDNCGTECEKWVKFCPVCGCKTFSVWIKKPIQVIHDPELLKKADKAARRYMLKKRLPVIALCVLCIVLMASTVGIVYKHVEYKSNSEDKYSELEKRYDSILEELRQLQIDNGKLTNERNELQYENTKLTEDNTILSNGLDDTLNTTLFFINSVGFVVHGQEGYHKYYCEYVKDSEFIQIHNKEYCENTLGLKPHSCWEDDDLSG